MQIRRFFTFMLATLGAGAAVAATSPQPISPAQETAAKRAALNSVDRHAADLTGISDQVWAYAETALREKRSAAVLAATMADLYEQPRALAAVQAEFKAEKGATVYRAYVPDGPPPVPKD